MHPMCIRIAKNFYLHDDVDGYDIKRKQDERKTQWKCFVCGRSQYT